MQYEQFGSKVLFLLATKGRSHDFRSLEKSHSLPEIAHFYRAKKMGNISRHSNLRPILRYFIMSDREP